MALGSKGLCGYLAAAVHANDWYSKRLSVLVESTEKLKEYRPAVCNAMTELLSMAGNAPNIGALTELCKTATVWNCHIFHFIDALMKELENKILAAWGAVQESVASTKHDDLGVLSRMTDLGQEASFVFPCSAEVQVMFESIGCALRDANQNSMQSAVLGAIRAFNAGLTSTDATTTAHSLLRDLHSVLAGAHGAKFKFHGDDNNEAESALTNLEDLAVDYLGSDACQVALAARSEIAPWTKITLAGVTKHAMLEDAHDLVHALTVFNNLATDVGDLTLGDQRLELLAVVEAKCARSKQHEMPGPFDANDKFVTVVSKAQAESEDTVARARKRLHDTASAKLSEAAASLGEVAQGGATPWYADSSEASGYDDLDKLGKQALKAVSGKTLKSRIDAVAKAPLYAGVWSAARLWDVRDRVMVGVRG